MGRTGMSEHQLQIALDGVIALLARSLYSDSDVFVRELIQNAHDAILKRRWFESNAPAGRIFITVTGSRIVVDDNGIGLTEAELHDHLSTIGRSGTRSTRESLHTHHEVISLIGQFGIGLLSTFLVAERVTVDTRAQDGPPLRWVSGGGRSYHVEPGNRAEIGTAVTLDIKPSEASYLHPGKLRRIVVRYTDLLPIPVYVVPERRVPCNRGRPPWEVTGSASHRSEAYVRWWRERFGSSPATVFRVHKAIEIGEVSGHVDGLIGYPADLSPGELHLDVYVSNVFITSRNRNLLPSFVGPLAGIIGTDLLSPNAARDDVMADAVRDAVRDAIGEALLQHIASVDGEDREDLLLALRLHADHLLPLLSKLPDDLLLSLGPHVPLHTDRGLRTLGEVIDASPVAADGVTEIHGTADWESANPFVLLCTAREIPVVALTESGVVPLLDRYLRLAGARLVRVDTGGPSSLLVPIRNAEMVSYRALIARCQEVLAEESCTIEMVRFAPSEIAALRMDHPESRIRHTLGARAADSALPDDLKTVLHGMTPASGLSSTLYINVDAPVIKALRNRCNTPADETVFAAIRLIHGGALLLGGLRIAPDALSRLFSDTQRAVSVLLGVS